MASVWRTAVLAALNRFASRHATRLVDRQQFLAEELKAVTKATGSRGVTPHQTASKTLQELRNDGLLEFLNPGQYLLLDKPLEAESEELPDEALDTAIRANKLTFSSVETGDTQTVTRRRRGQDRLRSLCLREYRTRCAVCDVEDNGLLIASHVIGWAESPAHRGLLANVICLCRLHDALFEGGYWSLDDNLEIVTRRQVASVFLTRVLDLLTLFTPPATHGPAPQFLAAHRTKSGLA